MNKEVFSKFTFGFLMAQLFPGIVAVSAVSLAVRASRTEQVVEDLWPFMGTVWEEMFTKPIWIPLYLFLAVGTGMLIHGLNWTVLAWLENHKNIEKPKPAWKSFWHRRLILFQLLAGPIKMVAEILWLLSARGIRPLVMEENAPRIKPDYMPNFTFLQDFYLYFAQFYSHTAYALLISIPCFIITLCSVGLTIGRCGLLLLLYCATSIFFLLGRVQLTTLFKAELMLCNQSGTSGGNHASRKTVDE